ncbi:hypothetical protein B0813_002965 [Candidatus Fervidibacteria bacterium JGI MDM2 SSWTFF-3-K9]
MPLLANDPIPKGITLRDAYTRIRHWYQANAPEFASAGHPWAIESLDLIENLPEESELSDAEIKAILLEVIMGKLEWGYHQSDGNYKMAAYAQAALEQVGYPSEVFSEVERQELRNSRLYPYSSIIQSVTKY